MMSRTRSICTAITLALTGALVGACDESLTSPSALVGHSYQLLAIDRSGLPSTPAPGDRRFTIEFQDGGRLAVRADCNSCSGTFELSGSTVTIRPLACTRAFCGNDSLDTPFLQALSDAKSVRLNGTDLSILSGAVTLRLVQQ